MAKDKYYGKTLRKNFARHEEVMAMPNLLEIQKKSYKWFLETGTGLDGSTIYQVVEVLAEAIQAAPAEAASSAWGVTIADGVITAVQ